MKRFFQQLIKDFQGTDEQDQSASGQHSQALTACVLFLEIAATDNELSDSELKEISAILETQYSLSSDEAANLMDNAETTRKSAVDLYGFTRIINDQCSPGEKLRLIEQIWRIIYADGRLDKHEDYMVHKLAKLLRIDHKEFIAAKLKVRSETT